MKKTVIIINLVLCLTVFIASYYHFHNRQRSATAYNSVVQFITKNYDLTLDRLERNHVDFMPEKELYDIQIKVKRTSTLLSFEVGVDNNYVVKQFKDVSKVQSD